MAKSFQVYRASNPRLHNVLNQSDRYDAYLKRIETIVDKKPMQDTSSKFYMTFLHRTKYIARSHQSLETGSQIGIENKHLLCKIVRAKQRKMPAVSQNYGLAMYQKRYREQERINQENKHIAKRITEQYSLLRNTSKHSLNRSIHVSRSNSPQKRNGQSWHVRLCGKKLPKLVQHLRA